MMDEILLNFFFGTAAMAAWSVVEKPASAAVKVNWQLFKTVPVNKFLPFFSFGVEQFLATVLGVQRVTR